MTDSFESLRSRSDSESFEPGEPIYREGEPASVLFFLVEGEVFLDRGSIRIGLVGSGELFGEGAIFGEAIRRETARAATSVRVVPIGPALHEHLTTLDPEFAAQVRAAHPRRQTRTTAGPPSSLAASPASRSTTNERSPE